MTRHWLFAALVLVGCSEANNTESKEVKKDMEIEGTTEEVANAPIAEKQDTTLLTHGHERIDPYFWMRLSDDQKEAETPDAQTQKVLDYLNAENAYKSAILKPTEELQKTIFNEIKSRIKEDESSAPIQDNGYYYYDKYVPGKEYEIYCRKQGDLNADEEAYLDVNVLAEGHDYYDVGDVEFSTNNRILAYSYDDVSRRQYAIVFKDLDGTTKCDEVLKNTSGDIVWANDNKTIFYVTKDETTLRENKIWRHVLGTPQSQDQLVFEESDETFYCEISKSKSDKYLFIDSYSTMSTEHQILEADNPSGKFRVFQAREDDHLYSINHWEDKWYVQTNWNAKNFRLMRTDLDKTGKEHWQAFIDHNEKVRISDIEVFKNHLVVELRENGLTILRVMGHDKSNPHDIAFDEETYTCGIGTNMVYDSEILCYGYSSLRIPSTVYEYNLTTGEQTILKQKEVLGEYNPENYETERVWATAPDGVKVPVSLVYKKGLKKDGSNPCLLYGYGSYGVTIPDNFRVPRLSLLDRGFIYAIAHIRGSEYLGRPWYEDGKKLKKINTFTDFIAASDFLIEQKYSSADKMCAMGGSAGGLLMGAVINMKPQNFKAVVAAVPFVDVVSTMLDESIPLTTGEFDEWGNPKNKEYYDYMLSYSPYDQVKAQDYPNLLITTGYWDSQVQYWEPAKWLARLRVTKTDNNIAIMDCNMSTGHGGASGRYEAYKETAMEYAFLIHMINGQ